MKAVIRFFLPCLGLLFFPGLVLAHHAFNAEFDREMPIELEGTVAQVQWTNPHARLLLDVADDNGDTVQWNLELNSPNIYIRQGWGKNTLKVGEKVFVTGWRARNDPHVGNVGTIKKEDGQELFTRPGRGNP